MRQRIRLRLFEALIAVWVLIACPRLEALALHGKTQAGMSFSGEVLSATPEQLLLHSGRRNAQLGLSVQDIAWLSPASGTAFTDFLDWLAGSPHLLTKLAPEGKRELLDHLESAGEPRDWGQIRRWADRLVLALQDPADRLRAQLLRAEAHHALGFTRQLGNDLQLLNEALSPLDAPVRLCWLNSRLAESRENWQEAAYWASLPLHRIPMENGPLVEDLRERFRLLAGRAYNRYIPIRP